MSHSDNDRIECWREGVLFEDMVRYEHLDHVGMATVVENLIAPENKFSLSMTGHTLVQIVNVMPSIMREIRTRPKMNSEGGAQMDVRFMM